MTSSMESMHIAAQLDMHASTGCMHCHQHTQGHGCPGIHGCSAELAALNPLSVTRGVMHVQLVLLPAALPHMSTVAFEPPLRPPPA
jgi:hypothetical protein